MTTVDRDHVPTAEWLLPTEAYTSVDWFDREQRLLFSRCWAFAGITSDIPSDGDYTCVDVGGHPLVVLRDADGELRAFHNICRHRGAQLLEGRGNVRQGISCFYHRWRYGLDGALKSVPQPGQFADLCKDDLGLEHASVDVWNGFMFVHVDPDPMESLHDWLGEFRDRLGPFDPLALQEVRRSRHTLRANWKLFFENHIDGYHLWHLHAKSIKGLDHARQEWKPAGRHWTFYEPEAVNGTHADAELTGLPVLPSHGAGGYGSSVHLVFPNLGVAGGSTFLATLHATPVAPDVTHIEARTWIAPMDPAQQARTAVQVAGRQVLSRLAKSPAAPVLRTLRVDAKPKGDFGGVVAEDLQAAEAIQHAMRSSRFAVGPMARDYESAITFFQRSVLDFMGE